MLHVKLLREEGFCDAVRLKDRDTFELYAGEASSWKRHSSAVDSKHYLLRAKSHGWPFLSRQEFRSLVILAIPKPGNA